MSTYIDEIEYTNVWFYTEAGNTEEFKIERTKDLVKYKDNVLLTEREYTATANSIGYVEFQLPDTVNMELDKDGNEQTYNIRYQDSMEFFNVPNQDNANLNNLIGE